jgi:hypothetical protein
MALNMFHGSSIPDMRIRPSRVVHAAAVPGGANDASFYTAFSSQKTVFYDTNPDNKTAQDRAKEHGKEILIYGLLTVAVLYVIYR